MVKRASIGGFSLMELLFSLGLAAILSLGMIEIASGTMASFRLGEAVSDLQERSQAVTTLLHDIVPSLAYDDQPWRETPRPVFLDGTIDGGDGGSDRLEVLTRTDRNCVGALNPDRDGTGQPLMADRLTRLFLRGRDFVVDCRFGLYPGAMVRQVRNQGMVRDIETLQFLFGEDNDGDGTVDRWLRAGQWSRESAVVALRAGLLLRSGSSLQAPADKMHTVLDEHIDVPDDGRVRRVATATYALRGRLP